LTEIPRYIGRANENGLFSINNIHPDTFRILTLKDSDGDMKYDSGSEFIAFLDSFLIINPATVQPVTFIKDTVKTIVRNKKERNSDKGNPSISESDTIISAGKSLNALNVSMYYFSEITDKVYLTAKKRDTAGRLFLAFNSPLHDSVTVFPLNFKQANSWFQKESSVNGDTLTYWVTDSLIAKLDTIQLAVRYRTVDSTNKFVLQTDTVFFRLQQVAAPEAPLRRSRSNVTREKTTTKVMTANVTNKGSMHLNRSVILTTEKPLGEIDANRIELFKSKDSVLLKQSFAVFRDTVNIHKALISPKWEENTLYTLRVFPGAVKDIYGGTNDTLQVSFTTQKSEYYGRLLLTVSSDKYPLIIEIRDQKGGIVTTRFLYRSGIQVFDYLTPQKYIIKAIYDRNGNRKWDTGDYLKHLQPEETFLYTMPVELRSDWDFEVNWNLSEYSQGK
jgi:uncharacterized protein (DUF2141 family)